MSQQLNGERASAPDTSVCRARVLVTGRVQGVGYRAFAYRAALEKRLGGGVRNLPDGRVEVLVDGQRADVTQFIEALKRGPAGARVDDVHVHWEPCTGASAGRFEIWY